MGEAGVYNNCMNYYLFYTNASIGEESTEEEREYVREQVKSMYDKTKETLKEDGIPSQVDRLIEKYGEKAVLETGYPNGRYKKPIIQKYQKFNCYGDEYEAPLTCYADGIYEYHGLTKESLRAYLQGYNYMNIAWAAGGGVLMVSEDIIMEELADDLKNKPRTFTLKTIPKKDEF